MGSEALTTEQKLRYCHGCRDDFYNGHNDLGVQQCWCLPKAKLTEVTFVHIDSVPPWHEKPEKTLDCHQRQRYVRVKADNPSLAKNWRHPR